VFVADLPPGLDPADVAGDDPARLEAAVEKATPFLRFRLDRVFEAADLGSNEGRARAAERALEIVAEHPTELVRDQYLMDVASRCRVEPDRLRTLLEQVQARPPRPAAPADGGRRRGAGGRNDRGRRADEPPPPGDERSWAGGPGGARTVENRPDDGDDGSGAAPGAGPGAAGRRSTARSRRDGPALEVLRHAVHDPGAVGRWLDPELFDDDVHRGAYQALLDADTHADALASSPPEVADLLARLLVAEPDSEPFDVVRRLHTEAARRHIAALRLEGARGGDATQALADLTTLTAIVDGLRSGQTAADSADRLLAWLGDRVGDGG
jgi:DNA primase